MAATCWLCGRLWPGELVCPQDGAPLVDDLDLERCGTSFAGVHLSEILGAGFMGVVYAAEHAHRGPGALKVLRPRFGGRRERLVAALADAVDVHHPSLVAVRAVVGCADTVAIEMARIDAPLLESLLVDGPLSLPEALGVVTRVAGALAALHAAGWVHGDLKPDNIALDVQTGEVVVLDWLDARIARLVLAEEQSAARFGTPHYMAPEIVRREPFDGAADVYALGLMCVDLLTGECAVDGEIDAVLDAQLRPIPLPTIDGLPAEIEALWARMVRPRPADRPTAAAVVQGLRTFRPRTSPLPR